MNDPDLACREELRRRAVRAAPRFGLDYAEVGGDQRALTVFFLGKAPAEGEISKANLALAGGTRIRDVQVASLHVNRQPDPTLDDSMEVTVNHPGDFSTYTLSVVKLDDRGHPTTQPLDGFDPLYNAVSFTFKASCPTDLDCKRPPVCPPPERSEPEINYLAKDYASFRQLILDRLALILPAWQETHVPDLGIALVELLAYAGDYLSYYQDAVATEAYLATARERISVRRHVRLVDYAMHEGCNARAWVTLSSDTDFGAGPGSDPPFDPKQIYFITAFPGSPANRVISLAAPNQPLAQVPAAAYEVFEPLWPSGPISIYAAHSEIHFYTWGDCECCLAAGATRATLMDQWVAAGGTDGGPTPATTPPPDGAPAGTPAAPRAAAAVSNASAATAPAAAAADASTPPPRQLHLHVGDVLIFEEALGPITGAAADADPTHRQAVRLTKVTPAVDDLYHPDANRPKLGQPIVEIEWAPEDALTFPLCISSQAPLHPPDPKQEPCACMENVSVARGNVILVDHGASGGESLGTVPASTTAEHCATVCRPAEVEVVPGVFRPVLQSAPLTFSQPIPSGACSAAEIIAQDPRQALPWISLTGTVAAPEGTTAAAWTPLYDLLESAPGDRNFVVEMDNRGYGHLRFGDGNLGRMPDAGTAFAAALRAGNGPPGNVGAETIAYLVLRQENLSGPTIMPRNPLAAVGGTAPEPLAEVKLLAPYAFRDVLERAITADDYATIAADNARRLAERYAAVAAGNPAGPGAPPACLAPFLALEGAKATLRWTGSWYEMLVALDPEGREDAPQSLLDEVTDYLEPYRRIGYDLQVAGAEYVPLKLTLSICVQPDYLRAQVERALLDVFSNRVLPDGSLGFFHPDNLTFAEGIDESKIVAAAMRVAGVRNAVVTELERFEASEPAAVRRLAAFRNIVFNRFRPAALVGPGAPVALGSLRPPVGVIGIRRAFLADEPGEELPRGGVLALGPFEIARLDNDPNFPEDGRLVLNLEGGR